MGILKKILLGAICVTVLGCGLAVWEAQNAFFALEVNDPTLERDPDFCPVHGHDHAQD